MEARHHHRAIDSEELAGAMATGLEDVIPKVAYRVVTDDKGRLQWRGMIEGVAVTETREPLASRWLRFKAWLFKLAPDSQL